MTFSFTPLSPTANAINEITADQEAKIPPQRLEKSASDVAGRVQAGPS